MSARGWIDFDDLILLPLRLLQSDADLTASCRSRYRWVSVDEYQDIDAAQYELIRMLVPAGGNLCVIGDPDQAIYGFRGADVQYFQRFGRDYPSARTIVLSRNYRSTQTIVDAALQLIAPASLAAGRHLQAAGLGPEQIEIHTCATDRAEAEFVVQTIEKLVGGSTFFSFDSQRVAGDEGESLSFGDFALLYRTEAQADALAEALARSGMPYQRRSHGALSERPLVQAILGMMPESAFACENAACGAGVPPARNAAETAAPQEVLSGSVRQTAGTPGLESVLDRLNGLIELAQQSGDWQSLAPNPGEAELLVAELRALAARYAGDMAQFLSELALGVDVDFWDPRADRILLLTLHAAKGLEFPVVFLTGCEDGLLPLRWGEIDEAALAEERRLMFVGMTRARQRLVLTHARKRRINGRTRELPPSPFLDDVERELLAFHQAHGKRKPRPLDRQRTLFE